MTKNLLVEYDSIIVDKNKNILEIKKMIINSEPVIVLFLILIYFWNKEK